MTVRAFITGVAGTRLTPAELSFLRESGPWGLIVFSRNIDAPAQLTRLTAAFREAVGRDAPVLVDQEGGRVQRLGPPHWPAYPPAAAYGRVYDRSAAEGRKAAFLGARLIAADLMAVGIDVDCLPVADVPVAGADAIIGDRAYGESPEKVAALAARGRRTACWRAASCQCSSTSRGMAGPLPTATASFPSSRPTAQRS